MKIEVSENDVTLILLHLGYWGNKDDIKLFKKIAKQMPKYFEPPEYDTEDEFPKVFSE